MNQISKNEIIKMILILVLILGVVGVSSYLRKKSTVTLDEYAKQQGQDTNGTGSGNFRTDVSGNSTATEPIDVSGNQIIDTSEDVSGNGAEDVSAGDTMQAVVLTGALLNGGADGQAMMAERVTYMSADDFYLEPLSENLKRYITGISYPAVEDTSELAIQPDELCYLHILHYNFEGNVTEGELICNRAIAGDLLDIFYELYRNEYQLESVRLIDEYDGDDTASMEANNTSCFNYRLVEGSTSLSKHALGLAIDVNPYYNPYITYDKQGGTHVSPEAAAVYADRSVEFPYKIDENDLCYKLFTKHGFTWGGNWNSVKDYQHFQKVP